MSEEKIEIPKLVTDFWSHKHPDYLMSRCECLNEKHPDAEKWENIAVFKCDAEEISESLYIVLTMSETQITVRELEEDEKEYLLHGTLPAIQDENDQPIT